MFKVCTTTAILFTYGLFCYTTMPSQCFTTKYAGECQRVQLSAFVDLRNVSWGAVNSVRVIR